ncbi:hypothetical protein [Aeromonas veronii]|jgi:hypothetical protein|uniref:hypothetical protein n=1 Tax=Aeromonas veronii TaxID=654 RepID=UPI003BA059B2
MTTIVSTKTELKNAQENNVQEIVVVGELADKLKKTKKIAQLSSVGLAALTGLIGLATVTAPATGGLSYLAAAPVAAFTGLEVAAIITAASLGLGLILAIFKGYEEIGYEKGKLTLKKRQR